MIDLPTSEGGFSISEQMAETAAKEKAERKAAAPAVEGYTGLPCKYCLRIRVYERCDGQFICEKCERFQ